MRQRSPGTMRRERAPARDPRAEDWQREPGWGRQWTTFCTADSIECRTQNAERRKNNGFFLNSAFCILRSAFFVILTAHMSSRVAIVRGLRTPFAKSGTSYARLSALDL